MDMMGGGGGDPFSGGTPGGTKGAGAPSGGGFGDPSGFGGGPDTGGVNDLGFPGGGSSFPGGGSMPGGGSQPPAPSQNVGTQNDPTVIAPTAMSQGSQSGPTAGATAPGAGVQSRSPGGGLPSQLQHMAQQGGGSGQQSGGGEGSHMESEMQQIANMLLGRGPEQEAGTGASMRFAQADTGTMTDASPGGDAGTVMMPPGSDKSRPTIMQEPFGGEMSPSIAGPQGGPPTGEGFGGGQQGGAAQPGAEAQSLQPPPDQLPRPRPPEAPTAPEPDPTTPPLPRPRPEEAGPGDPNAGAKPSAGGQPPGGGQQPGARGQQQQFNPLKAIVDLITKGPMAFFQDLLGLAGQNQQGFPNPMGFPQQPRQGTAPVPPQSAPVSGGNKDPNEPGISDEEKQARIRARDTGQKPGSFILNPKYDPNDPNSQRYIPDPNVPNNPAVAGGAPGGQRSVPGGGGPVNWKQIAAAPASTHAQNFNQPLNSNLATDRARFRQELQNNPRLREKILRIAANEQGNHPQGTQAIIESMMNRASIARHSLAQEARWTGRVREGGYYDARSMGAGANLSIGNRSLENALNGSNISNYATDNSSNAPGNPLAYREMRSGRFINQSQYTGEYMMSPGTSGNFPRSAWQQWVGRMNSGGQPPAATAPTAPAAGRTPAATRTPAPYTGTRAEVAPNTQSAFAAPPSAGSSPSRPFYPIPAWPNVPSTQENDEASEENPRQIPPANQFQRPNTQLAMRGDVMSDAPPLQMTPYSNNPPAAPPTSSPTSASPAAPLPIQPGGGRELPEIKVVAPAKKGDAADVPLPRPRPKEADKAKKKTKPKGMKPGMKKRIQARQEREKQSYVIPSTPAGMGRMFTTYTPPD